MSAYEDKLIKAHIELKRNWQKVAISENEAIPPGEYVHCPLTGQQLIPAAENCPDCPQFHGIGIVVQSRDPEQEKEIQLKMPWRKRRCICCISIMELPTVSKPE